MLISPSNMHVRHLRCFIPAIAFLAILTSTPCASLAQTAYSYSGHSFSSDGTILYAYTVTQGSMSGVTSYNHSYYAYVLLTDPSGNHGTNDGTSSTTVNAGVPTTLRRDTQISSASSGTYLMGRRGYAYCTFVGAWAPFFDTGDHSDQILVPPVIGGIRPSVATQGASLFIEIYGTHLSNGTNPSVNVDGTGVTVDYLQWVRDDQVNVHVTISGSATVGRRALSLSNPGGLASIQFDVSPSVSFSALSPGLGAKGGTATVTVTLSSAASALPIVLSLITTSGQGSVVFSDDTATKLITSSGNVTIKGKSASSAEGNIQLKASPSGHDDTVLAAATTSAVMVTLSLHNQGVPATDNDSTGAGVVNSSSFNPSSLGTSAMMVSPNMCVQGVEIVGSVTPANFSGTVVLRRTIGTSSAYNGATGRNYLGVAKPPGVDDSLASWRDDKPQSGGSAGKVYDIDAPGIGPLTGSTQIWRTRMNFHQYAAFSTNDTQELGSLDWYAATSCKKATDGISVVVVTDVSGDNRSATGSIPVSWNLQ